MLSVPVDLIPQGFGSWYMQKLWVLRQNLWPYWWWGHKKIWLKTTRIEMPFQISMNKSPFSHSVIIPALVECNHKWAGLQLSAEDTALSNSQTISIWIFLIFEAGHCVFPRVDEEDLKGWSVMFKLWMVALNWSVRVPILLLQSPIHQLDVWGNSLWFSQENLQ